MYNFFKNIILLRYFKNIFQLIYCMLCTIYEYIVKINPDLMGPNKINNGIINSCVMPQITGFYIN